MMQKNKTLTSTLTSNLIPMETYRKNVLCVIQDWEKRNGIRKLRDNRYCMIGYLKEKMDDLNNTTSIEDINHIKQVLQELIELDNEISNIEFSIHD